MIYQLLRTSPLLGGNVKWNMILNSNAVADLQIVPISNYIKFNYNNKVDTLNYSHIDNIKSLYNKIQGQFFDAVINPELSTTKLVYSKDIYKDTHSDTYEAGFKRLPFKRYNKQFEVFCPIWCDNIEELNDARFFIVIENPKNNNRVLFKKEIILGDKIYKYINQYCDELLEGKPKSNKSFNELIYLSFKENLAWLKGVNVKEGIVKKSDISYLIPNITSRERPLIESDSLIANTLKENDTICMQLFNFAFSFNITDIIDPEFIHDIMLEQVNCYIDIYTSEKKVEVKDLYTNYDVIPAFCTNKNKYIDTENVLNYLNDNKCVDLITKNKISQSIFQWALQDNNNISFNLYDGYSPVYYDGNKYSVKYRGITNSFPDIYSKTFIKERNPFGHFHIEELSDITSTNALITIKTVKTDIINGKYIGTKITKDKQYSWLNELKIDNTKYFSDENNEEITIYNYIFTFDNTVIFTENQQENIKCIDGKLGATWIDKNEETNTYYIVLFVNNANLYSKSIYQKLLYQTLISGTESYVDLFADTAILQKYQTVLKHIVQPTVIEIKNTLSYDLYKSPDGWNTDEIEYNILNNSTSIFLYRYDLGIYPKFISIDDTYRNYTYWCKQYINTLDNEIDVDNIKQFNDLSFKKVSPVFKSVDYFILKGDKVDYDMHYAAYYDKHHAVGYDYNWEYSWFKKSKRYILPAIIEIENTAENLTQEAIDNLLFDYIENKIDMDADNKQIIFNVFIRQLYDVTYTFDYKSEKDISEYIYKIKYTLK